MSANLAAQQKLAERLGNVLRRFEHEGGSIEDLAAAVGETGRDLRRWAEGTKLPGHVFCMLLGELPRHLADLLIRPTGLRLEQVETQGKVNALLAAAGASEFSGAVARGLADGRLDHRERAELGQLAEQLIPALQALASE
jgi:hypothetical protein